MDIEYLLFLQGIRESAPHIIRQILVFISEFIVGAGGLLIPACIYWCFNKRAGRYILFNFGGATVINQFVKNTACVYRPWIRDSRVQLAEEAITSATGYSFPSGHTTLAVSVYGGIAVSYRKKKWLVTICVILIGLTAFARNWLCAHTPQDVIVGLLLSTFSLWLTSILMKWEGKTPKGTWKLMFGGIAVSIGMLIYITVKPYPMDYTAVGDLIVDPLAMMNDCYNAAGMLIGFLIGYALEKKYIQFQDTAKWTERIIRAIAGMLLFLLLNNTIFAFIRNSMGPHWGNLVRGILRFMYIMFLYPCLIYVADKVISKKEGCA